MTLCIGVREENKNEWERRAPLTPRTVSLLREDGIEVAVQSSKRRVFPDRDYEEAGATLQPDVSACPIVLGIKEVPASRFRSGGVYMFFSHTIKGQPHNMAMLRRMVELGCTLLDYELVVDARGRRLIFFGRYAGLAGMIDTLWLLGRRLAHFGWTTPLLGLEPAHRYADLASAKAAVSAAGARIAEEGLPAEFAPWVVGFSGYGHVSQGAQEIFDLLPHRQVAPSDLAAFVAGNRAHTRELAKVVYKEEHIVEPAVPGHRFELQDYYDHPEQYRSAFGPHLGLLTVLVNGIFWSEKYPRLATRDQLRELFSRPERPRLLAVGDITCDVNGSVACTVRETHSGDPVYIYDPNTGEARSGVEGEGLAVLAVGNLPCELPRESSETFSDVLRPFIPALARMDLEGPLEKAGLPEELSRSVILWRGEFSPGCQHLREFVR